MAERAFLVLVALALASSLILVALLVSVLAARDRDPVFLLLLLLAFIGIGLGMTSLVRQLWATYRLLRGLLALRTEPPRALRLLSAELGLAGRVDLVRDPRPFSFTYWFLRPRICVSTGLLARLGPDELRAVLCHERYHVRCRDPLRLVIARYFAAGLYAVPLIDDLVEHYVLLKEVAADEDAVRALGTVRPLARALYRLMPHADEMDLGLLAPVGGLSVTEARIEQLVQRRPIALRLTLGHVALSGATLLGASLIVVARLPHLGPPEVQLAWPPAALILMAAISGGPHQLRAVMQRSVPSLL